MNFGERLKEARKAAGLTQEQLGKYLGVTGVTIMRYEKSIRFPDYDTLMKLASYFGVTVDYLLGNERKSNSGENDTTISLEDECFLRNYELPEKSDKKVRISCRIDSNLYEATAIIADYNEHTIEDEVEDLLSFAVLDRIGRWEHDNRPSAEKVNLDELMRLKQLQENNDPTDP